MDAERREELRRLCEAATPGPWRRTQVKGCDDDLVAVGDVESDLEIGRFYNSEDAEFASTARTALPELLDEVEALQARVRELERLLSAFDWAEYVVGDLDKTRDNGDKATAAYTLPYLVEEKVAEAVAAERERILTEIESIGTYEAYAIGQRIRAGEQEG